MRKWTKNERKGDRKSCEGRKMRRLRAGGRRGDGGQGPVWGEGKEKSGEREGRERREKERRRERK